MDASATSLLKVFSRYEGTTPSEVAYNDNQCYLIGQHMEQLALQKQTALGCGVHNQMQNIEECLCLGIWVYRIKMLRSIPPKQSQIRLLVINLQTALLKTTINNDWNYYDELLLWIAFMGGSAFSEGLTREWYVKLLKAASFRLELSSWEATRGVLQRFLWISRCESFCRALWTEVENYN